MSIVEEIKKTTVPKKQDESKPQGLPNRKQGRIALLDAIEPRMITGDRVRATMSRSSLEDLKGEASMTTYVMRYIRDERLDMFVGSIIPSSIRMQDGYKYEPGDVAFLVSRDESNAPSEENCDLMLIEFTVLG